MKFSQISGRFFSSCVVVMCLAASACSDSPAPTEYSKAIDLLNDTWDTGCQVNPTLDSDPDSPVGYFRETLTIETFTAVQTFEYFQDSNCTVGVTADQVADEDETLYLTKQSQVLSVGYPAGETVTDLGIGYYLDLDVISVSIDDVVLTEEEMQEQSITLDDLQGLFVITESERLHINTSGDGSRPTDVPLDYSYTKSSS